MIKITVIIKDLPSGDIYADCKYEEASPSPTEQATAMVFRKFLSKAFDLIANSGDCSTQLTSENAHLTEAQMEAFIAAHNKGKGKH